MILVFGKNGQVARALQVELSKDSFFRKEDFIFLSSDRANFLNPKKVIEVLDQIRPKWVINASAYTAVDLAEDEKEKALVINGKTPGEIADWCFKNDVPLVHFSTDYIFSGSDDGPYFEDAQSDPINHYGVSKKLGDDLILKSQCSFFIFRASWIYSPWGNNFPKTILRLLKEKEKISVVSDQWGSPTNAESLARIILALLKKVSSIEKSQGAIRSDKGNRVAVPMNQKVEDGVEVRVGAETKAGERVESDVDRESEGWGLERKLHSHFRPIPYGIYHLSLEKYQSWYQFALEILKQAQEAGFSLATKEILPIKSVEYKAKAKRPLNSRLGSYYQEELLRSLGLDELINKTKFDLKSILNQTE